MLADQYWNVIEPLVQKACEPARGEYTPKEVRDYVKSGKWLLWLGTDPDADMPLPLALAATHLEKWADGKRVCRITLTAADDMDDWQDAFKTIHDYAAKEQCACVLTLGRQGWQRQMGWKPVAYVYEVAV